MVQEQLFFIQILSDFIHEKKSEVPDELNIDVLMHYARMHEMMGITYYQTNLQQFQNAFFRDVYLYKIRQKILNDLTATFDFDWFLVKGTEVAKLYPVPELRTMGDCDIVVKNREVAHKYFLKQGFENKNQYCYREWQYYKMNLEFELHDCLFYKENTNNHKQEGFFNNFWKYVRNNKLNWNFHFLYLISHLRKHFMYEGVGFRPFVDIAIVIEKVDLDWEWIKRNAEEIELLPFLKMVLALCERWFLVKSPIEPMELENDFYEASTQRIFENGIFGHDNDDNKQSSIINLYRKKGKLGITVSILREFFPSYKFLSSVPKYSFLRGRVYLMPVAWIYRIASNKKKIVAQLASLRKYSVSAEKIKEREEVYSQWRI